MRLLTIVLPLKPVSTNTYLEMNRRGHVYTSSETIKFKEAVADYLELVREDLLNFRVTLTEKSTILEASYFFYIPQEIFYTVKGELNTHCYDWDNSIKVLQDCVFSYLVFDDMHIKKAKVSLIPSDKHCISILVKETTVKYKKSPRIKHGRKSKSDERNLEKALQRPSKSSKVPRHLRGKRSGAKTRRKQ